MMWRPKRRHLPLAEWGLRGAVAFAAALLGFASVSATLANVVTKIDPGRAHRLAPNNGHITAAAAEQSFALAPVADSKSQAARLAQLALRQDATAVGAISVLGLQAQLRRDLSHARELFHYSHKLSRRELRTHLWMIEEAVARGDIAGALNQYDLALQTSRKAQDLLFPALAQAIREPAIRSELLRTIADQPIWLRPFIRYVAANAADPRVVVPFFLDPAAADLPIDDSDRRRLIRALMAVGATEEAWAFYESFRANVDRRRSRDSRFALDSQASSLFDWMTFSPDGITTSIQGSQGGGVVHFIANPGAGGTILRQTQLLPPGEYRLDGRSYGITQPEHSRPYWTLACHDAPELGRINLPNSGSNWRSFTGRFTVPEDCSVQTLALIVRASDDMAGVQGQLSQVKLLPSP